MWKNPDAVARASLGACGKARYVNSREFGEPNDRRLSARQRSRSRQQACAAGGRFFLGLSLEAVQGGAASVPFHRIINNTVYGGCQDHKIRVWNLNTMQKSHML